jgi:hypothetical protein
MTYELVKQLKDADFPTNPSQPHLWISESGNINNHPLDDGDVYMLIPTLSELIAACGDGNFKLIRTRNGELWSCEMKNKEGQLLGIALNYSTPEEAVAKLWIELNKIKIN